MPIDRAFVRIAEGLVHYRYRPAATSGDVPPLYMVHAGPVSSSSLVPLMEAVSPTRSVYAPDTLGFGDTAPPMEDAPEISYYADSVVRILDALEIDKIDYYGSHTGANIGCELAIRRPDRVRKLILEGIGLFDDELRQDLLENYAPAKQPDAYGSQFQWAWQFLRDQTLFFPYFKRDAEHRLRNAVLPPDHLHHYVLDVLKALTTYHKGYNAVFRHRPAERLSKIEHPVLFLAHADTPLEAYLDEAAAKPPNARKDRIASGDDMTDQARRIERFLNEVD